MEVLKIFYTFNQFTIKTGAAKPDKIEKTDFKLNLNNATHNEVVSRAKLHLILKSINFYLNEWIIIYVIFIINSLFVYIYSYV